MTTPEIIVAVAVGLITVIVYAAIVGDARYRQTTQHAGATADWSPTAEYHTLHALELHPIPMTEHTEYQPDEDAIYADVSAALEQPFAAMLDTFNKNMDAIQTWLQTARTVIWFTDLEP